MSFVIAAPGLLGGAATNLARIGSSIGAANASAAAHTTSVVAAAGDEVSVAISALFGTYGQEFQALSAQAGLFHEQFVQALNSGGSAYAGAEAANVLALQGVWPAQSLLQDVSSLSQFSPVKALTGRPLVGDGANGAPGSRSGRRAGRVVDR